MNLYWDPDVDIVRSVSSQKWSEAEDWESVGAFGPYNDHFLIISLSFQEIVAYGLCRLKGMGSVWSILISESSINHYKRTQGDIEKL